MKFKEKNQPIIEKIDPNHETNIIYSPNQISNINPPMIQINNAISKNYIKEIRNSDKDQIYNQSSLNFNY